MNIVLVHLGKKIPKYAIRNMDLLQQTFDDVKITLIHDHEPKKALLSRTRFESQKIILPHNLERIAGKSHDLNFRNGFWFTSLFRIIAICDLVIQKDEPILHIENDVLLFPNFPLVELEKCKKLMWLQFNKERDVASLIFIPDRASGMWLKDEIERRFLNNSSHTDMSLLREIANSNPDLVDYFPIAESRDSLLFGAEVDETSRDLNSKNFEMFGGIFDSAPIGMFLLGRDPRNHRGMLVRFLKLPESYIKAERIKFNFDFFEPKIQTGAFEVPIFNLHVHAKIPKVFTVLGINKFIEISSESEYRSKKTLSPVVFVRIVIGYCLRKVRYIWPTREN